MKFFWLFSLCLVGLTTFSYSENELPPLMPQDREISLAESAGPPGITKQATIYVLERGKGYVVAKEGNNGFACYVHRDRVDTLEPECFDPEGARTFMKIEIDRARLREQGMTSEKADAEIDRGIASGTYQIPKRNAVTYMLSTKNRVFNGKEVISYPPHIMISAPYLKNSDIGADFVNPALPWVLNEGTPRAYIIVVVGNASVTAEEKEHRH